MPEIEEPVGELETMAESLLVQGGLLRRSVRWLPQILSGGRILLGLLFTLSLDDAPIVPLAITLLACASDFLDGRIARRFGVSSRSGATLDVAADGVFLLCALGALAAVGRISLLSPIATAVALAAFAAQWHREPLRAGSPRRAPDRAGHVAGVLNFALALVGSAAPLLPAADVWLWPLSIAVALSNAVPLVLRSIGPSTRRPESKLSAR